MKTNRLESILQFKEMKNVKKKNPEFQLLSNYTYT